MISPSRTEYLDRDDGRGNRPVRAVIPADLETPVSVFIKLRPLGAAFLFESVEQGVQVGRHSFIGLAAGADIQLRDGQVTIRRGQGADAVTQNHPVDPADPLGPVRQELAAAAVIEDGGGDLPPPFGGAVGFMGFDMVRYFEDMDLPAPAADDLPDYRFLFPRTLVVFDHVKSEIEILTLPDGKNAGEAHTAASVRIAAVLKALQEPLPEDVLRARLDTGPAPGDVAGTHDDPVSNVDRNTFMDRVERAREHILAGDAFQIVLSQQLTGKAPAEPFRVYRALRMLNPSPYLFFLDFREFQLVGSSPEMLVRLEGDTLQVNPIAGTRPRAESVAEDNALAADLLNDDKERAEHVMLVDLGRNDLGRVCRTGTVQVDDFMTVERYSHVMHLVSRVSGRLEKGLDMFDALRATFPAGTVSGAPKIRAMEILTELESQRRGPYAGAVGYFGRTGDMDMCITIRTLLMRNGRYSVQAGAGIVADSDPAREYQETLDKARALTRAVRIAHRGL
ncbi:MAG: anthranilate synthase component I [Candidatus Krumholzibacteriota bacterium]